jgi:hypothetical protein
MAATMHPSVVNESKVCQDDLDNLFLLFDVHNKLNPLMGFK